MDGGGRKGRSSRERGEATGLVEARRGRRREVCEGAAPPRLWPPESRGAEERERKGNEIEGRGGGIGG